MPPVTSFDARLIELFRIAADRPVRVIVATRSAATRLRFRLHSLRKAMRKEKHPMLNIAEAVTVKIKAQTNGTWLLLAVPTDADFADALTSAGIDVDAAAASVAEKVEPMDEFLSRLVEKSKEDEK